MQAAPDQAHLQPRQGATKSKQRFLLSTGRPVRPCFVSQASEGRAVHEGSQLGSLEEGMLLQLRSVGESWKGEFT